MKEFIKNIFKKTPEQIAREKRKRELLPLIRIKENQAISEAEFIGLQKELGSLSAKELKGDITDLERERQRVIRDKIAETSMSFDNLFDFKIALECLQNTSKRFVHQKLNHENAHANKGESLGATHEGYSLIFTTTQSFGSETKHLNYGATANFDDLPEEWISEKRKQVAREIAFAPEEYGDQMSESDKRLYESLNK